MSTKGGLLSRLSREDGGDGNVVCAEGYLFQFERRGYLKAGAFVPEVVLEHPELVKQLYAEFVHAGSDVIPAFMYYAHREKMRVVNREEDLEAINRRALQLAKEAAEGTRAMVAGNICNTTIYERGNDKRIQEAYDIFKEQITWSVEANADFILAESYVELAEAKLALKAIKDFGNGLPGVVNLTPIDLTADAKMYAKALLDLENAGASVVGLNCGRGYKTMFPLLKEARKICKGPLAAVPVPYRTSQGCETWHKFKDCETGKMAFPTNLDPFQCTRDDMSEFARECQEIGVQFVGVCCGNSAHHTRAVAEALGRSPPASRYSADMSQHFIFNDDDSRYDPGTRIQKLFA